MARKNEDRHADEIKHHRRDVHHVVRPITPARQKSVELAENFLSPEGHAAFSGIAMRQFDHGNSLRPEKQHQRNNPEPNSDAAVCSNAGQHIQVKTCYNKQRDKIPAPERSLQMRGFSLRRDQFFPGLLEKWKTSYSRSFPAAAHT